MNLKGLVIVVSMSLSCNSSENETAESKSVNETKGVSVPPTNNEDEQIRSTLNNFYSEYLSEITNFPVNEVKLKGIKSNYCSGRLLRKLDTLELDYDPFTNPQDFDANSAIQLNITKKSELSYKVSFAKNNEYSITLFLIKERNRYYIDSILDLY